MDLGMLKVPRSWLLKPEAASCKVLSSGRTSSCGCFQSYKRLSSFKCKELGGLGRGAEAGMWVGVRVGSQRGNPTKARAAALHPFCTSGTRRLPRLLALRSGVRACIYPAHLYSQDFGHQKGKPKGPAWPHLWAGLLGTSSCVKQKAWGGSLL